MSGEAAAGGRYRIVRPVGEGGMGTVLEAVELATGRTLALKRLRPLRADAAERTTRLFQQEFHTLRHLAHPRVVDVYDYGRDAQGDFYTMELLDGGDLRALSPLPWRRLCALMCDICSALSMLHSRRLVHRDLSPRNIRCTADGKAKLIDFGAMAPFGPSRHVVGTPASTAPETLLGQVIDARTDLFALGAAAYYGLTRHHAYRASSFRELRAAWRSRPAPPSRYAADVPRELDELVLSLLQLSPLARPASAAEVIERLCAIAELTLDEQLPVSRAYLITPTLVGRDELVASVRQPLLSTARGNGGTLLLSGAPGIGRSRLLDACVLEGKLLGALVLRADVGDAAAGPWGAARALLAGLHQALPALGDAPEHLTRFDESGALVGGRAALQAALREHILSACRRQPLMLAVDDLPRLDEPSAALIALLADGAAEHPLFVVATAESEACAAGEGPLGLIARSARRIELAPLTLAQSEKLLRSVFGDVPNVGLLADRLHSVAAGNPRSLMQLAQHLLDRGVVSYQRGRWTLPSSLDPDDIPASIADALRARFAALGAGARRLSQALALSGVPSLSLEECLQLSRDREPRKLFSELDELVAAEVVGSDGERYALSQPAWRGVVLAELPDADARELHLALSVIFEHSQREPVAAQHARLAGDDERALTILLAHHERSSELLDSDLEALTAFVQSLPEGSVRAVAALVARCRSNQHPRSHYQRLLLQWTGLASLRAEVDADLLCGALPDLLLDSGLSDHAALDDAASPTERLTRALTLAQQRFESAPEIARGLAPVEAMGRLGRLAASAIAYAGRAYDRPFLDAFPSLAPLAPLSPALAIIELNRVTTCHLLAGRTEEARSGYLELLERLAQAGEALVPNNRRHMTLAVQYALGLLDAQVGSASALEWADAIAPQPMFAASAERLRLVHALLHGDEQRAETHRHRLERLKIQNCPPQLFEGTYLWTEVLCHAGAEDLVRVKELLPAIEQMASKLPNWQPILCYARAQYHGLRGDCAGALSELERACASLRAGEHLAWPAIAGALIAALTAAGEAARAVAYGREQLEAAERQAIRHMQRYLLAPLSLAEAELGDHGMAVADAERALSIYQELGATGAGLGAAHEARARVAIAMRDEAAFEHHAERCAFHYRVGHNQALTAKYERLMHLARRVGVGVATEVVTSTDLSDPDTAQLIDRMETVLSRCEGPRERAERILGWLNEGGCFFGGFLFTLQQGGPQLSAHDCQRQPPEALKERVAAHLASEVASATVAQAAKSGQTFGTAGSETDEQDAPAWPGVDGARFVPVVLWHELERGVAITAIAVMCLGTGTVLDPPEALLHAMSRMLHDNDDVVTLISAG